MSDWKHANIVNTLMFSVGKGILLILILFMAYLRQYYSPTIPKRKMFH